MASVVPEADHAVVGVAARTVIDSVVLLVAMVVGRNNCGVKEKGVKLIKRRNCASAPINRENPKRSRVTNE